jgi:riboflavin-specific deaminase-like protein
MRQLLPHALDDVDVYEAYRPTHPDRALLRLNMVSSADGAVVGPDGRSGTLGAEGDREVFRTLRAHADAILIGAGTVRAEGYGPHRLRPDLAARRSAEGRPDPAAVVVVTRSLDLDLGAPLFTAAATPTIVLTCDRAGADADRRARAARVARVIVAGQQRVDLAAGLTELRGLGLTHVLAEGGPALNSELLALGAVDELCLTIAPALVGPATGLTRGLQRRHELNLLAVLEQDGELYLRYAVAP